MSKVELGTRLNRRQLLRGAGTATTGAAAIALVGCGDGSSKKPEASTAIPRTVNGLLEYYKTEEPRVEETIKKADAAMATFQTVIENSSSLFRDALLAPIAFYSQNKENPNRNFLTIQKEDLQKRGQQALTTPGTLAPEKDYFFYIGALYPGTTQEKGFIGQYSSAARELTIKDNLNPNDLFESLVLYHETVHALQDSNTRRAFSSSQESAGYYFSFNYLQAGEKPRILGDWEQEAYMLEVHLANVATNGDFRKAVETGDIASFMKTWNIPEGSLQKVQVLREYAKVVFSTDAKPGKIPAAYKSFVNGQYRALGNDVYTLTPDKKFVIAAE